MGRKRMALALTLCLLLSGCGGGGTASKLEVSSTKTQMEISAVVLDDVETAEPAEDSQVEPKLDDMTPEELGQWLWAQMEAHNAATYAVDYELNMQVKVTVGRNPSEMPCTPGKENYPWRRHGSLYRCIQRRLL